MTTNQISITASTVSTILSATGKVFVAREPETTWGENQIRALEITLTTETFGFVLSEQLCKTLSHFDMTELTTIGQAIIEHVKTSVGGYKTYQPMYPNFPAQVLNASEKELIINATLHYVGSWFGLRILPNYEKIARSVMEKNPNPKVIDLCSEQNLHIYIKNMATANVSYSPAQVQDIIIIAKFLHEQAKLDNILHNVEIPNKENLAMWANLYLSNAWNFNEKMAHRFVTTTDVLRLVAAYSSADTSLAKTLKVGKLPRSVRKVFMSLLENVCNTNQDKEQVIENLLTYRSEWVRIAHALHIGEYSNKYKTSYEMLYKLRNNEKVITFNSRLEEAYSCGDAISLIATLQTRPGVFARNLTRLLVTEKGDFKKFVNSAKKNAAYLKNLAEQRTETIRANLKASNKELTSLALQLQKLNIQRQSSTTEMEKPVISEALENKETVVDTVVEVEPMEPFSGLFSQYDRNKFISSFDKVVDSVSTPILLQLHSHFKNIEKKMLLGERAFMPKGGLSKVFYQTGSTPKYNLDECKKIENIAENALISRFAKLPSLGKVYISPELETQHIPFAMRSASKALKTVARGSSFKLDENDSNIRMFLWWKDAQGERVDIDLSVSMYGDDFQSLGHCSYWNLRDKGLTHSGDIVSAPNGACEFIDIDKSLIDKNVAYIVMSLSSYTGQKYCDLPECFAGWMEKSDLNEGEIFDARNVKNKIDLSSDTTNIIPIVYDVKNNRMIWIDTSYGNSAICTNAANTSDVISMILQAWIKTPKPNLYDLFKMHAEARGQLVDTAEEAEKIFSVHEGVTPYDFDIIASEYMTDTV